MVPGRAIHPVFGRSRRQSLQRPRPPHTIPNRAHGQGRVLDPAVFPERISRAGNTTGFPDFRKSRGCDRLSPRIGVINRNGSEADMDEQKFKSFRQMDTDKRRWRLMGKNPILSSSICVHLCPSELHFSEIHASLKNYENSLLAKLRILHESCYPSRTSLS